MAGSPSSRRGRLSSGKLMEGGREIFQKRGCNLAWIATNHPGGGAGYRLEHGGRSVVYLTDNELDPPYEKATGFDEFVEFCRQTDVLIFQEAALARPKGAWPVVANHRLSAAFSFSRRLSPPKS